MKKIYCLSKDFTELLKKYNCTLRMIGDDHKEFAYISEDNDVQVVYVLPKSLPDSDIPRVGCEFVDASSEEELINYVQQNNSNE